MQNQTVALDLLFLKVMNRAESFLRKWVRTRVFLGENFSFKLKYKDVEEINNEKNMYYISILPFDKCPFQVV